MAKTCATCGSPIDDNSRFCTVCGTPVAVQKIAQDRYCVQCGNLLRPGIKFCEVCGREVAAEKPKEEPVIAEPTTMDELVIPEITDDMFAGSKGNMMNEKFDGFEAAVMPDSKPAQPEAPAPTPEFAMDSAASDTSKPKQTVNVKVKTKPVIPPNSQTTAPPPAANYNQQYSQPNQQYNQPSQQYNQQGTQYSQPANNNPYPNPGIPIPTVDAKGNEKRGSMVVPAILILLIVIVLIADVIIFSGKKKDDSAEKDAALIVSPQTVSVQTGSMEISV